MLSLPGGKVAPRGTCNEAGTVREPLISFHPVYQIGMTWFPFMSCIIPFGATPMLCVLTVIVQGTEYSDTPTIDDGKPVSVTVVDAFVTLSAYAGDVLEA